MPLLILGLLIIVGAILYMRFIKQDGDPSIGLRPEPAPEEGDPAAGANAAAGAGPSPAGTSAAPAQAPAASTDAATPTAAGTEAPAAGQPDGGGENPGFSTMEELTEFYRKEAERITGIKH